MGSGALRVGMVALYCTEQNSVHQKTQDPRMHTTKWRTSYSEQDKRDIYYFKTFANLHHYYHLSSTSIPLTYGKIVRWWPMKEGGRRKKEEEGGKRRKSKRKGGVECYI